MNDTSQYEVVLTEKAAEIVREAFAAENVETGQSYLRIGAVPGGCSGYKFDMDYADSAQVSENDQVFESNGVKVVVDRACLNDILGSIEIDYQTGNMVERGFKFRRLINGAMCGCGESFTAVKDQGGN